MDKVSIKSRVYFRLDSINMGWINRLKRDIVEDFRTLHCFIEIP